MDRRQFLKFLAQSSASVGATVFVEKVWGFPTISLLSKSTDKLYFWGENIAGLATTTGSNILTPTRLLPRHKLTSIKFGGDTAGTTLAFATTKKGDIITWGNNTNYQQGPLAGSLVSPALFGNTTMWSHISSGSSHSVGVRTNGTLWVWGSNTYGQLGDGTTTLRSSPVQLGALNTWSYAEAGMNATFALRTNGTLWAWGAHNGNYLGVGASANVSSPVQIGVATNWTKMAASRYHVLAIKTDGTLWAWGQGGMGQLGNGVNIAVSTPIQVGADANWAKVYANIEVSYGIKTNGTLWAWGWNDIGELGIGTIGHVSSPVQIGSATNWVDLSASISHAIAIKADSTIWGWGKNEKGQLGTGAITPAVISTPIQIGSSNSWAMTCTYANTSFGIRIK